MILSLRFSMPVHNLARLSLAEQQAAGGRVWHLCRRGLIRFMGGAG